MKKLLATLALLLAYSPLAHAQFSRITQIRLENFNGTVTNPGATYSSPFSFRAGPNCSWTHSANTTISEFNCTGGGVLTPGGAVGTIQYNNSGVFGGVTGVTNGVGTNCDGFGTSCKFSIASPSGDYIIVVVPTGSPAGSYAGTGAVSSNGVSVGNGFDAWDGTNYGFVVLNSLTGLNINPKVTSPKYIFPQGPVGACGVFPSPIVNAICEQAPASVTTYSVVKPPVSAQGTLLGRMTAAVITQGFSGDADHSNGSAGTTIGSGTSIGSTSLCSTANCPVGIYRVNVYVDITTACGATGTYVVNLIYTDDQGSKTVVANISGTGAVPATGVLTLSSTANFGQVSQIIRSTGAASINYSTTAVACGAGGPMVGKLYLSVEPVQ